MIDKIIRTLRWCRTLEKTEGVFLEEPETGWRMDIELDEETKEKILNIFYEMQITYHSPIQYPKKTLILSANWSIPYYLRLTSRL